MNPSSPQPEASNSLGLHQLPLNQKLQLYQEILKLLFS
jgi:hypothetical protein